MTTGLTLLLVMLAEIAIPGEQIVRHARTLRGTPLRSTDSIDVLLFSIPSIVSLTVRDAHLTADGKLLSSGPAEIRSAGRSLSIGSLRASTVTLAPTSAGRVVLHSGKRARSVAGIVRIANAGHVLIVVSRMALPEYLAGTLAAESRSTDPREYRIALAALQRNYAATHGGRHTPHADVCDNTHCQLFRGTDVMAVDREIVRAASTIQWAHSTRPSYYSACCGGGTMTPLDVWGKEERGYARVDCDLCGGSRWYRWRSSIKASIAVDREIAALPTPPFVNEEAKIRLGRALGWYLVPSNTVDGIVRRNGRWILKGRGFGHRVGLCQEGARRLAAMGWTAGRILDRYFPRTP